MASELDDAYDNARDNLPEGYLFTTFIQDSDGWLVSASRKAFAGDWRNTISARGGTLTKALNHLADRLKEHNATST